MYNFWAAFFLALVVFILRLPVTIRRIRDQREALRPVEPVARGDHLPCIMNTIGVVLTEFALLGLLVVVVFISANATLGTIDNASDFSTGLRELSLGTVIALSALMLSAAALSIGLVFARYLLLVLMVTGLVLWLVINSVGDDWPAIILFGLISYAGPAIIVLIVRRFF